MRLRLVRTHFWTKQFVANIAPYIRDVCERTAVQSMDINDAISRQLSSRGSREEMIDMLKQHGPPKAGEFTSRLAVRLLSAWSWGLLSANTVQWLAGVALVCNELAR